MESAGQRREENKVKGKQGHIDTGMISSAWGRVPARKARREATGLDLNQETPPDEQHELATILPIPHSFYSPSSQGLTSPVTE